MITQELIDYIKSQTAKGESLMTIKSALLSKGWNEEDISKAMYDINSGKSNTNSQSMSLSGSQTPVSASPFSTIPTVVTKEQNSIQNLTKKQSIFDFKG